MERLFSVPLKGGKLTDVYRCSLSELEGEIGSYPSALAVFDDNSLSSYGSAPSSSMTLPPGEEHKDWTSIDMILKNALGLGLARDSMFIGIGGGVILDMTAFAASIYMRGARCILVPTTLLSAVDATLGGKTGIDYGGAKNTVGTFFPADKVLIVPQLLRTLPEKEYRSGLGEVLKHAILSSDDALMRFLIDSRDKVLARDEETVMEMIRLSLEVKISYITRDPEETKGIRSALNLGHTFGHALEALSDYMVSHGEAVAWGVQRALDLGRRLSVTPPELAARGLELFSLYGYDGSYRVPEELFPGYMDAVAKDKKKKGGAVRFILMEGQGSPVAMALSTDEVRSAVV